MGNKFLTLIIIFGILEMSCFGGCFTRGVGGKQIYNRVTNAPIRFNMTELEQLRKKFLKVSVNQRMISRQSFKKNMGILGLHCAQQFSQRMFNAFDLDNDGEINFQDFIEYMQILKCGNDASKAKISFKMIAKKQDSGRGQRSKITQKDFMDFLNDFFNSWSSITNISITQDIRSRTDQYVSFLFNKVTRETGKAEINIKYYVEKLYKDKDYMEAFQFITQGMADIFINDQEIYETNPEVVLYRVLKELKEIKEGVFDINSDTACFYEPVRVEESPKDLPILKTFFNTAQNFDLKKPTSEKRYPNASETVKTQVKRPTGIEQHPTRRTNAWQTTETHEHTKTHNFFFDSRKLQLKEAYQNTVISCLTKKLKFIQQKIDKIISSSQAAFNFLQQKFSRKEQLRKGKNETAKNVHKRLNKNRQGDMVFLGDDNWNLVLNMMIGIQMAVRSVKGFQEMIYEEPKDFGLKYYFQLVPRRFGDEEYKSTIYSFTDYAPNTFNHIRKLFKIDNEDYIGSIGPNRLMASLMMGEVSSMTSLTSQGKSGSFFYYTADGKYMLKTMSYREYKFLRSILEDYYYYLKQNPDTMITRFYGLHKLIEKNVKGDQICRSYFVIMANVFNTKEKIVERYDIKGSWQGRQTTDKDPTSTKKDNDFKKRSPIFLQQKQRNDLLNIIKKDAEFFEKHQIIDYSLLIGVIRRGQQSENSEYRNIESRVALNEQEKELFPARQSKLFLSPESSEVYIFGIIDILTPYEQLFNYQAQGKFWSIISKVQYMAKVFLQFLLQTMLQDSFVSQKTKSFRRNNDTLYSSELEYLSGLYNLSLMIDSASFADELLGNVQFDLCNLEVLDAQEFVQRLLCFPCNGLEERLLIVLREVLHHFQNERAIMKYIYIIDKLIKVPSFLPAIHQTIVGIYSDLFAFMHQQKCSGALQELKILRKFWVGKLHPQCLAQMKEILLQRTGLDIDTGFKPEMINRIRDYYTSKLCMNAEEVAYHLPVVKREQNRNIAQRYQIDSYSLYSQQYIYNYSQNYSVTPQPQPQPQPHRQISIQAQNTILQPIQQPQYQSHPQILHQAFLPTPPIRQASSRDQLKRKRLASQQTRSPLTTWQQQPQPRKVRQGNENTILDYKAMLWNLRRLNPFDCKQCGLQLMCGETLEKHKGQHMKEKLTRLDRARQSRAGKLCSVQEWRSAAELPFSPDQFYISIPKQEIQQPLCLFCYAPLESACRNNQWVYTNATKARYQGNLYLLHKTCQLALENTAEE